MEHAIELETFRDFLRVVYKHKLILIIIITVVMSIIFINQNLQTPEYKASAKMLVTGKMPKDIEYHRSLGPGSLTETIMQLVKSRKVLTRAVKSLKLYERPLDYEKKFATELKKHLIDRNTKKIKKMLMEMDTEKREAFLFNRAVSMLSSKIVAKLASRGSSIFSISARDYSASEAKKIANIVSRSFLIFDLETQIAELNLMYGEKNVTVQKLNNYVAKLEKSLDGSILSDLDALGPASVKLISQAEAAELAQIGGKLNLYIIGFIISLLLWIVISYGLEYIDQTISSPKLIDRELKIPFLGSIPKRKKFGELIMNDPKTSDILKCVQAYQRLGDKICLNAKYKHIKSFLITAFEEFYDTSALIGNLGIYLSRDAGRKVLLIDANIKEPTMNKIFAPDEIDELNNILCIFKGEKSFDEAVYKVGKNLDVLFSKPTNFRPIKILDSPFMANLIREAKNKYDIVLVNCGANLKIDSDPIWISSYTDASIIVINEGKDRLNDIKIAINSLKQNNNMIFTLLNNRTKDLPNILYKIS
jgi:capsular polysaccharide biosynthesis protein